MKNLKNPTQSRFTRCRVCIIALVGCVFLLITGCAGGSMSQVPSKFQKSLSAYVGYFSDNTVTLISESDMRLSRHDAFYIRPFLEKGGIEERKMDALLKAIQNLGGSIVKYSITLVTIAEANKLEEERIGAYAEFLDSFSEWKQLELVLGYTQYEEIIETVRQQETGVAPIKPDTLLELNKT